MAKTQGTILLKKGSPTDLDDFFGFIFFKANPTKQIDLAGQIVNHIIKESYMMDRDKAKILDSTSSNEKQYYHVLARLKALGLIFKKDGAYRISETFSNRLKVLSYYWDAILSKSKESKPKTRLNNEEETDVYKIEEPKINKEEEISKWKNLGWSVESMSKKTNH